MARILVTGGAGYVGSVCARQLLQHGHEVVVLDDLSTGHAEAVPSQAKLFRLDYGDRRGVAQMLRTNPVDAVFHFAAKALIPESVSNPGYFFDVNVASAIAFLETLRDLGVKRFVFSSSAAVYGNPKVAPIPEDHAKDPVNSYGETKLMLVRLGLQMDRGRVPLFQCVWSDERRRREPPARDAHHPVAARSCERRAALLRGLR
jgi:UDP-glucose 4-epimerase